MWHLPVINPHFVSWSFEGNLIACNNVLPVLFVFPARDWVVPARVAFFDDHGGQFCDVRWPATDARGGIPLSWLASTPSCHHLSPGADAVIHLVRKRPKHLLHFSKRPNSTQDSSTNQICGASCNKNLHGLVFKIYVVRIKPWCFCRFSWF